MHSLGLTNHRRESDCPDRTLIMCPFIPVYCSILVFKLYIYKYLSWIYTDMRVTIHSNGAKVVFIYVAHTINHMHVEIVHGKGEEYTTEQIHISLPWFLPIALI